MPKGSDRIKYPLVTTIGDGVRISAVSVWGTEREEAVYVRVSELRRLRQEIDTIIRKNRL